jgi:hypothetical protein
MMLYDKNHGNNYLWVGFVNQRNQDLSGKSGVEVDENKLIKYYYCGYEECKPATDNCLDHALIDGFYKTEPV